MADFYLDEDVDAHLADLLTARGHSALTTAQADRLRSSDDRQLLCATDFERILVTHNGRDYRLLCRLWRDLSRRWGITHAEHAGVLVIPQNLTIPFSQTIAEIHNLVRGPTVVRGEFFSYERSWGWIAGLEERRSGRGAQ